MSEFLQKLNDTVKAFAQGWAGNATVASLVLYVFGYLSLRFHLTVFGIPADLDIVDEQYVFQGARFFVFFLPMFPSLLVLAILVAAPPRLGVALFRRWASAGLRQRCGAWLGAVRQGVVRPGVLLLASTMVSLAMIQLIMRRCFEFHDVLLASRLGGSGLLRGVLLDSDGLATGLYFVLLLAGTGAPGLLWWSASRTGPIVPRIVALRAISALLILLQVLLLPVNYGVLVADKGVYRVRSVPFRSAALQETEAAWLIWRGKEWTSYLVRDTAGGRDERVLVTVRAAEVKTIEATSHDRILEILFPPAAPSTGSDLLTSSPRRTSP